MIAKLGLALVVCFWSFQLAAENIMVETRIQADSVLGNAQSFRLSIGEPPKGYTEPYSFEIKSIPRYVGPVPRKGFPPGYITTQQGTIPYNEENETRIELTTADTVYKATYSVFTDTTLNRILLHVYIGIRPDQSAFLKEIKVLKVIRFPKNIELELTNKPALNKKLKYRITNHSADTLYGGPNNKRILGRLYYEKENSGWRQLDPDSFCNDAKAQKAILPNKKLNENARVQKDCNPYPLDRHGRFFFAVVVYASKGEKYTQGGATQFKTLKMYELETAFELQKPAGRN